MASIDEPTAIEEIYSIAINPDHPYHSNPQIALSLLSAVANILQSADISGTTGTLKLAISYIYLESASNSGVLSLRLL
jgi:hypothetical protein